MATDALRLVTDPPETPKPAQSKARSRFGALRRLPSGRWQARYTDPYGNAHTAPHTFDAKGDADDWLAAVRVSMHRATILGETWVSPEQQGAERQRALDSVRTFTEYAHGWLAARDLKPTTRALYESLLRIHLDPTFGEIPLQGITPESVRSWHGRLATGPTAKANAYGLLRTIMIDALADGLISVNPVNLRAAGSKRRARELKALTGPEFNALVEAMPVRYKGLVLVGGWCALRFGELAALRRSDVDLSAGLVHVRRAVTRVKGQTIVGQPKADSRRSVSIPPHILPALVDHLAQHAQPGRDGLVFPPASGEGFLALSTLHRVFDRAKVTAGRPDIRVHDLRHFGLVMAARNGATIGELQQRAGHRTAAAAMIYQSAVSERPHEIAASLSRMAEGWADPLV